MNRFPITGWRSAALLLAAAIGIVTRAQAQPFDTPPPPAAPRALNIDAPVQQTLANGLRVVVAERRGVPLVSAQFVVLAGSETDPPRKAGLASLTAGLLTKGTQRRGAPALAQAAEALGGSLESGAGWDQSSVLITVTTPQLSKALGLVSEVVRTPTFAAAEFDRLRTQTLDGLRVSYASPSVLAGLAAERLVFGAGAYGHPAAGTPLSLPRIARADVLAQHREHYRPERSVLVLAGDIGPAEALRLAVQHFGGWRAAPAAGMPKQTHTTAIAPSSLPQSLVVVDMNDSGQAGVVLALPVPPRSAPDHAAGEVTNAVLGGDFSSRLNQEIRIKRGLSYVARSQLDTRRQGGLLRASMQTKNESAAEVVGLVQAEIDRLVDMPVPDAELAARKAALIGNFSRSVETTAGLSAVVSGLLVNGQPATELQTRIATLQAVTAADVQRYAATHFGAAKRRIAVAGEARQFEAALRTTVPGLAVVKQEQLDLEQDGGLARPN